MMRKTSAFAPMSMPRLGSSISSTFGAVSSALPITTFCWLPPDSDETGSAGSATLIDRSAHLALHLVGLAREPECGRYSGKLAEARHGQILGDGQDRHQPVALAVLGDQREAAGDAAADVALAHRLAVDEDAAGRQRMATHHAFEELAASRPHQAVDADDLAGANR